MAVTIGALRTRAFTNDIDNDGQADSGDPYGYDVTVANSGNESALVVQLDATVKGSNFADAAVGAESMTVESLTLGNTVFLDANNNGAFDSGEGVNGVTLSLFADADNNGVADGAAIATTTTAGGGLYSFTNLAEGNYIVSVDASNFAVAGALEGRLSVAGGADPDDNVDNDDNGVAGPSGSIVSRSITLSFNAETTADGTGQFDINNTLDFGFFAPNTAPVNSVPGAQSVNEDATRTFSSGNGNAISVSDVDAGSGNLTVTLTVDHGALTLGGTTGLSFSAGDGTGDATMTFSGTASAVNTALNGLTYAPTANYNGSDTLTITTNDNGNTGADPGLTGNGTSEEDTDQVAITVTAVNDTPVVTVATPLASTEQVFATIDAAATVHDADLDALNGGNGDYGGSVLTIVRQGGASSDDHFQFASSGAFSVNGGNLEAPGGLVFASFTNSGGTLTITFNDSAAVATTALVGAVLDAVQYSNANDTPPASIDLSVSLNDGAPVNAGQGDVAGHSATGTATIHVAITDVDDAPVSHDDAFTTDEATAIVGGNLFADNGSGADSDPDGPPLSVSAVNGSGANVGTQVTLASGALLTVNSDGTFDYDPNGAFDPTPTLASGASNTPDSDSFTYAVAGGGTATVTITIDGLDTDDSLLGTGGNDTLDGGIGADQLSGGTGNDIYFVDGSDSVTESAGEGNDKLWTRSSFTLGAGSSVERLATINASHSTPIAITGNELAQTIYGNAGANALSGGGGGDWMFGLGGNDTLTGGVGTDKMYGGTGDDIYNVDSANDRAIETAGEGNDKVVASVSYGLNAISEVERLETSNAAATTALNLTGNDFAQTIEGNAGANYLNGRDGNDMLIGNGGNDRLVGAGGTDDLRGGAGDDRYYVDSSDSITELAGQGYDIVLASDDFVLGAGVSVERMITYGAAAIDLTGNELAQNIYGNGAANVLSGGGGNDYLVGNGGSDRLIGGEGADNLRGGAGTDVFVFDDLASADRIGDFSIVDDTIELDSGTFSALAPGALAANAFHAGTSAQDADDRIIYDNTTGWVWYDPDGTGGASQTLFLKVDPGLALTSGDFLVG